MKIIIKNPAPMDTRQKKWGDYHFGRCLSKYLSRLGAKVETHYKPQWQQKSNSNAVIVLRGKYLYHPTPGPINILWVISHPGAVTPEECKTYDVVCVASHPHAQTLKHQLRIPVYPLLQCTDMEEFYLPKTDGERRDIIFVGNTRGVPRPSITWALEYGLPLKIYGRGWSDWIDTKHVVADYVENSETGELYGRTRFTFNDHWHDMKSLGYINNRIFDAFACGLPIISDYHEELHRLFPDEIPFYSNREEFYKCIEKMLLMYPIYQQKISSLGHKLKDKFSFESRAKFIHNLIKDLNTNIYKKESDRRQRHTGIKKYKKRILHKENVMHTIQEKFLENKSQRFCPICYTLADNFLPFGTPSRSDAKCPSCQSLESHRLFWIYFQSQLYPRLKSGTKHLLHFAPEKHLSKLFQEIPGLDYISADLDSPLAMVKIDLTNIEFPDLRFDIIVCSHILEHISNDLKAMQEMFRVIKAQGYLIVQVPVYSDTTLEDPNIKPPEERKKVFAQADHARKYGFDIVKRLEKPGFQVKTINLYNELGSDLSNFLGIKNQVLFECHKFFEL